MQNFIMRLDRAFAKRVFIFFIAALFTACGVARFGYQHGATVSYWWLNSYVDFEADQQAWAKKRIDAVFAWQNKTHLKDYVQLLASAQKRLQRSVTHNELLTDADNIKKHMVVLLDKALPDLADLALALRPQQIAHIEKKYASNNETFRKEYLRGDVEQRQKFRFKKVMQQAEYWFGHFSNEQEILIRKASDARPLNNELLMADRQQRQKELIVLLKKIQSEKPGRDAVIAILKDYAASSYFERSGISPELRAYFDATRESSAHLALVIINLATPEQKAHAVNTAQRWIDDFNLLAATAS